MSIEQQESVLILGRSRHPPPDNPIFGHFPPPPPRSRRQNSDREIYDRGTSRIQREEVYKTRLLLKRRISKLGHWRKISNSIELQCAAVIEEGYNLLLLGIEQSQYQWGKL